MKFDFDFELGLYGQHSFAWRASAGPLEELRSLAKLAIASNDFAALSAWAEKRRVASDERQRALVVEVTSDEDQRVVGLINSLRAAALHKRQEKPEPLSLAGKFVSAREWAALVTLLEPLQKYRDDRDAAFVFAAPMIHAAHELRRLARQAFVPSEPPISPSEALRLGLETVLDFATGEFGVGGFWGDLFPGPRHFSTDRPFLFPFVGKHAEVRDEWLKVLPSKSAELGTPYVVLPGELTWVRSALQKFPEKLSSEKTLQERDARAHVARAKELVVELPSWSGVFREPVAREWVMTIDWRDEYPKRRAGFFAEMDRALAAKDALVFIDAVPTLVERPAPVLADGRTWVQPKELEALWTRIFDLSLERDANVWCLKGIEFAVGPIQAPSNYWQRLLVLSVEIQNAKDKPQRLVNEAAELFKRLPRE